MKNIKSVIFHALEFFFVLLAAYVITKVFTLQATDYLFLIGTLLAGFAKFARVSPKVPVPDWVNSKDQTSNQDQK